MRKLISLILKKRFRQVYVLMLYPIAALFFVKRRKSIFESWIHQLHAPIPSFHKTLLVNFMCLPKAQARKIPILIFPGVKITSLSGRIEFTRDAEFGSVEWGLWQQFRQCGDGTLRLQGSLIIDGSKGFMSKGVDLNIFPGATLKIGDDFWIGENCSIFCTKDIQIGKHLRMPYQSQILDSDFHFVIDIKNRAIKPRSKAIKIGDYVWIGNRSTIKKGVVIPDNTMIAASYAVVTKNFSDIPPYSILGGCPAKLISSGFSRAWGRDTIPEIEIMDKWFMNHPEEKIYTIDVGMDINEFVSKPSEE